MHNAKKANANNVWFEISNPTKNTFRLEVSDDGDGLDFEVQDVKSIFEKGVTTKKGGSGLGLYHSREILAEMGGSIEAAVDDKRKIIFRIDFAK